MRFLSCATGTGTLVAISVVALAPSCGGSKNDGAFGGPADASIVDGGIEQRRGRRGHLRRRQRDEPRLRAQVLGRPARRGRLQRQRRDGMPARPGVHRHEVRRGVRERRREQEHVRVRVLRGRSGRHLGGRRRLLRDVRREHVDLAREHHRRLGRTARERRDRGGDPERHRVVAHVPAARGDGAATRAGGHPLSQPVAQRHRSSGGARLRVPCGRHARVRRGRRRARDGARQGVPHHRPTGPSSPTTSSRSAAARARRRAPRCSCRRARGTRTTSRSTPSRRAPWPPARARRRRSTSSRRSRRRRSRSVPTAAINGGTGVAAAVKGQTDEVPARQPGRLRPVHAAGGADGQPHPRRQAGRRLGRRLLPEHRREHLLLRLGAPGALPREDARTRVRRRALPRPLPVAGGDDALADRRRGRGHDAHVRAGDAERRPDVASTSGQLVEFSTIAPFVVRSQDDAASLLHVGAHDRRADAPGRQRRAGRSGVRQRRPAGRVPLVVRLLHRSDLPRDEPRGRPHEGDDGLSRT